MALATILSGMNGTSAAIIKQIEQLGFHVSTHRMMDYDEMHAVPHIDPSSMVHIARVDGGDDDDRVYQTTCALAEMVGIDLEDG